MLPFLAIFKGANFTGLAATLLAGIAIGGFSGWQVQAWRLGNFQAETKAAQAEASVMITRERLRAVDQAITDNATNGEFYAQLQDDLRAQRSIAADRSKRNAALERLLSAQCPASQAAQGLRPGQARGGTDGVAPEWRIDHWLATP